MSPQKSGEAWQIWLSERFYCGYFFFNVDIKKTFFCGTCFVPYLKKPCLWFHMCRSVSFSSGCFSRVTFGPVLTWKLSSLWKCPRRQQKVSQTLFASRWGFFNYFVFFDLIGCQHMENYFNTTFFFFNFQHRALLIWPDLTTMNRLNPRVVRLDHIPSA